MYRPIAYHYRALDSERYSGEEYVKNVHSFGNPALYWLSMPAVLIVIGMFGVNVWRIIQTSRFAEGFFMQGFIIAGYFAAWLPWSMVSRCTFFYHYQTAAVFSFLATAYVLTSFLWSRGKNYRRLALGALALIIMAFVFWLPFQLGIDIPKDGFYLRMWFRSWI